MLGELQQSLSEKDIRLTYADEVRHYLAKQAENGVRGARDLRIAIRKQIEDVIANLIIDSAEEPISGIHISVAESGEKLKIDSL